jgi:hypothetical protein
LGKKSAALELKRKKKEEEEEASTISIGTHLWKRSQH